MAKKRKPDRTRTIEEKLDRHRKEIEAGKLALGEAALNDPETQFWSDQKTRPYMQAMNGLACALHSDGQTARAIDLWQELLRLDPQDNQGIRTRLAPALVEDNQLVEAEKLLKHFGSDGRANMIYSWVLCLFKKHGDCPLACKALHHAIRENRHVVPYLCGFRQPPKRQANSCSPRSPEEAHGYFLIAEKSWLDAGAVDWLAAFIHREVEESNLAKTFPGMPLESQKHNVVDVL